VLSWGRSADRAEDLRPLLLPPPALALRSLHSSKVFMNCGHPPLALAIPGPSLSPLRVVGASLTGRGGGSVRSEAMFFPGRALILKPGVPNPAEPIGR
jgi:hypothetical protein